MQRGTRPGPEVVRATPSVRAHARELGVDLSRVKGSGPQRTITRADVETAAKPSADPAETLRGATDNAEHRAAENTWHAEMHFFA